MTHTPGPWKVDKNHKGFVNIRRDVNSYTSDIATVWDFYAENYESNTSLIAAAPDMLEALEGAKWLIDCYVAKPEGYEEYQDVVKAIRKARLTNFHD